MTRNSILIFGAEAVAAGQERHDLEDKARQKTLQLIDKVCDVVFDHNNYSDCL